MEETREARLERRLVSGMSQSLSPTVRQQQNLSQQKEVQPTKTHYYSCNEVESPTIELNRDRSAQYKKGWQAPW